MNSDLIIENYGKIYSGGGGGGGGQFCDVPNALSCGGSGGGGQGYATSSAGIMPAGTAGCWSGAFYPRGSSGSNGSFSAAAAGGSGASLSSGFGYTIASAGGNGGVWGENGVASVAGFCHSNSGGDYTNPGRAGGTSGRAVRINGYNLIFNIGTGTSLLKDPLL